MADADVDDADEKDDGDHNEIGSYSTVGHLQTYDAGDDDDGDDADGHLIRYCLNLISDWVGEMAKPSLSGPGVRSQISWW